MSIIDKLFKTAQEEVKLPYAWGVLYSKPNSDGSRKKCENCWKWTIDSKCLEYSEKQQVLKTQVCGLHTFGKPQEKWYEREKFLPADPSLTGLEDVNEGTSCDICKFYSKEDQKNGLCLAVSNENLQKPPQKVEALGCCARWERI